MEEKKIPARGFQNIEHFFLSTGGERDNHSNTADAIAVKNVDTDHSDCMTAVDPAMLNKTEMYGIKHRRAHEGIGSTVAKLEVLKRSCQGVALQAERSCDNTVWFQGAAAIIQEAICTLSEVMKPVGNNDS